MCRAKEETGRRCASSTPAYRREKRAEKRLAEAAVVGTQDQKPRASVQGDPADPDYWLRFTGTRAFGADAIDAMVEYAFTMTRRKGRDPAHEEQVVAWAAALHTFNSEGFRAPVTRLRQVGEAWLKAGLTVDDGIEWADELHADSYVLESRHYTAVTDWLDSGKMLADATDIDRAWLRAGVPQSDREAWGALIAKFPRVQSGGRFDDGGYGSVEKEDLEAALAAATAGNCLHDDEAVTMFAWERFKNRVPADRVVSVRAINEVEWYLTEGGTLAEATAYQAACATGKPGANIAQWTTFAREAVAFNPTAYTYYRKDGFTPDVLKVYVDAGNTPTMNEVSKYHQYRRQHCPTAPLEYAVYYQSVAKGAEDITAWEERRKAGDDPIPELQFLHALKG